MLAAAQSTNLAVRFLLELAALTAVGVAAWQAAAPGALRWVAVTVAPIAVAAGWVLVVHGEHVPPAVRAAGQVVALVVGAGCLVRVGATRTASTFVALAVVNAALLAAWNQ